jgi:hypothetical protein
LGVVETMTASSLRRGGLRWFRLIPAVLMGVWALRLSNAVQAHCVLDWVNLPFHEAGHLFLAPFGNLAHFLGGTLMQLFVPALLTGYFLTKGQPFPAALCFWWLGENLLNVSVYMADARELRLDLVGGGEHDWNEIFYRLGLLGEESVARISAATHHLGAILLAGATAWMLCLALPEIQRRNLAARCSGRFPAAILLLGQAE